MNELPPTESTPPSMRPKRSVGGLFLAVLAVAIGGVGQGLLRTNSLWDGLLLLAVSVLLFILAVEQAPSEPTGENNPYRFLDKPWQVRPGLPRLLGMIFLTGALILSVLVYRAFDGIETLPRAWNFYLISLAFLLLGTLLLTRGKPIRHLWPETTFTRLLLLLIFLLALFLRLWRLDIFPPGAWYDEAISGLQAVRWNAEPFFRPQFKDNNPGQLIFLYAQALRWFGQDIWVLRLVQMGLGMAGVLAAYLFGRELRGVGFGLALAFFTAAARWHVNFSRIAMPGVDTPFFVFLSLFFLTRLLRGGRLRDAVWAGLSIGLGLSVYSAFRLFGLALAVFLFLALIAWRTWLSRLGNSQWRLGVGTRLAIFSATLWLAALPIIHFARTQPDSFWSRVQETSIFNTRDESDLGQALWHNTRAHLLMFNFSGDHNGRHNLPGEPMLDPAMGVLFVLGVGLAAAQVRQPANLFFLNLFAIGLLGGILSLDFEAPQSLRSIAVLPAVIYFCALALVTLGRLGEQSMRGWPAGWRAVPILMVGAYVFFFNAHTYFVRQAQDFAVWNAFSTSESIVGRQMARLGPDYIFYLSPFFANHPTIKFLSPQTPSQQTLTLPDPVPVRQPADRPAALFIHPADAWIYEAAEKLYSTGEFEIIFDERGETPVVYQVVLDKKAVAEVQGVELRYWAGPTWEGLPQGALRTQTIDSSWSRQSPPFPAVTADEPGNFTAEWAGILFAPDYGPYEFTLHAPAAACLGIDGQTLASLGEAGGDQAVSLTLAQGNHRLQVRAVSGEGRVRLDWQRPNGEMELIPAWALYSPPVSHHGLQGSYYANPEWAGLPAFVRIDPFLDIYFHLTPLARPYTVEWTGVLDAPVTGLYGLGLRTVGEAQLFVDGQLVVENTPPDETIEGTLMLNRGQHNLLLRFKDTVNSSRLHLLWRPPGQTLQAIPPDFLLPPSVGQSNFQNSMCDEP